MKIGYYMLRAVEIYKNEGSTVLLHKIKNKITSKKVELIAPDLTNDYFITSKSVIQNTSPLNNPEVISTRINQQADYSLLLPFDFNSEQQPPKETFAAIIHVYYVDLLKSVLNYVSNIPFKIDLIITTDSTEKKDKIESILNEYPYHYEVRIFVNRGRDIAPMLVGCKDIFDKYDYVLHLHTKKSPHGGSLLSGWGGYCYDQLLGSKEIVRNIIFLLTHEKIGIVSPQHYDVIANCVNWGWNFTKSQQLLRKMGLSISLSNLVEFPSGSMFWVRSSCLKPLLDLNLNFEDFEPENGQVDGTLAHAIERIIFYVIEWSGYRWLKVVNKLDARPVLSLKNETEFKKKYYAKYLPLKNQYSCKKNKILLEAPEYKEVNVLLNEQNTKPRINLVINTLNKTQIFGGVATALKLFNEIRQTYSNQLDYRIIVCDALLDHETKERYKECYSIFNSCEINSAIENDDDCNIVYQITSTLDFIPLRQNDLFITTAWWTNLIARQLVEYQKYYFKTSYKIAYLIQDYEPNFYQWSSKWALAESSYDKLKEEIIPIINSEELSKFFEGQYSIREYFYLPYEQNKKISQHIKKIGRKDKEKKILVYARPSVYRNAFTLLVDGVAKWQSENPIIATNWEILCVGEKFPNSYISNLSNTKVLGKLSLADYADLLNSSAVGVSLMISMHPSYPPLEMANNGVRVVTNKYSVKDLTRRSANVYNIKNFTPEAISNAINEAVSDYENNSQISYGLSDPNITLKGKRFNVEELMFQLCKWKGSSVSGRPHEF